MKASPSAVIYCDTVTPAIALKVLRWRLSPGAGIDRPAQLRVLDPLAVRGLRGALVRALRWSGVTVEEVPFFTGQLQTPTGEAVYLPAKNAATDLALESARRLVGRSRQLGALNSQWGRATILKIVAGSLATPALETMLRVFSADALRRESDAGETSAFRQTGRSALLLLRRRWGIDADLLPQDPRGLRVAFCGACSPDWRRVNRTTVLLMPVLMWIRGTKGRRADLPSPAGPALLLLQEDELSVDRSYRTQPHWLFPEDGTPPFRTLVLQMSPGAALPADLDRLRRHGLDVIPLGALQQVDRRRVPSDVRRRLRGSVLRCVLTAVTGRRDEVDAMFEVVKTLLIARQLAALCVAQSVRAFLVAENYMAHADAMLLVAPLLGVRTLSYQYANRVAKVVPRMLTTADVMILMSPFFEARWTTSGIRPLRFESAGYLFDRSFSQLRARASAHRAGLASRGARFVIGYFDESVQFDKYGLVSERDHVDELGALLDLVQRDPTIGLIVKSQFSRNAPEKFPQLADAIERARATGRYLELTVGAHRNIVFAAEAAMAADITIGHLAGATAALEAALAGARSILLDPYRFSTDQRQIFDRGFILYPSLNAGLTAIAGLRRADPDCAQVGDWSPILTVFDPFRDGRAALRLRRLIFDAMGATDATAAPALGERVQAHG